MNIATWPATWVRNSTVIFAEIVLGKSSYHQETQIGAAADQGERALGLDFLAKGKAAYSETVCGRRTFVSIVGRMPAFTVTYGLIRFPGRRTYLTRVRPADHNVKQIEVNDRAQFG